ncbi:terminal uridylyltransferase 4-like isoform X2 [Montipora foliosa]|uniref:terminal uridylyltransferase 4-like isoform X2 n=1 Tax=Montipora foliosa TaxID=591990 RepID=UPI0035F16E04
MKNSEVSEPSSENSDDLKTENSRGNTRGDTSHTKRTKQASKEKRREVHKAVTDDQTCEEEYAKILKNLESQHFVVSSDKLEDPSKSEGAPFYCELCSMKIENVQECPNHVITKAHKKAKKAKGEYLTLCRVKSPSQSQISALNRLLEAVFHEHGLCPVKELPIRQEVAKDVSKTIHVLHPECAVSVFGSSLTGFGLKDSDINLDLVIPDQGNVPHILLSILDLLQKNESYSDVKSDFDAKVPRILFKHVSSGLDCELSPGNFTASKTSHLLKKYYELDPRVRLLAVGLRYWARVCSIDCQSDGGLPGYSLALMVIQFLQEIKPPVLPRWIPSEIIDDNSEKVPQDFVSSNRDVTGNLWFQLFRFYCIDFDIPTLVISIKEPVPVKRKDRNWGQRRIAVEDPFSTKRNVASSLSSDKVWDYFFTCWKNSFFYWASLPSNSPTKSLSKVPSVEANTFTKNKSNNRDLKVNKRERELENREDGIFEMDDLDNTTKQIPVESMENCDVDSAQKEISSQEQGKKNFDQNDTGEDIEITLSESESEKQPGILGDAGGGVDLREKNSLVRYKDRTNITAEQEVEYRFDAQVFRGNSRPIKTCCYCKEDGHVKESCPDLRKPSLKKLPPITAEFGALLDYVCTTCRADFEFDKEEVAYRERVLKNLEGYIHEIFPDARLYLFGSSKNGFGFRNSDIDICMTLENHVREEVDAVDVITKLARLLKKHKDCASVLAITTAKVPIVKFYLRSCKREADISLYNTLALENTDMLATYAKLDERVATLGYTVKVFAKVCDIGDASKGSLSSYAYILMLLHYLQQCQPPVIPVLQSLHTEEKRPEKIVDDWNCWFCSDLNKINSLWKPKERNRMSAGLLWIDFLKYYTEVFDFEHDVVCCRGTKKLTKFEKMWTKHVFAIEDPFNLDHNLGAGVTRKMATYIMTAFIKGRERFGFPRYDIPIAFAQQYFFDVYFLTDGYEAPNDRNCRVCGKIGHIAKDCPRSKSNKRAERLKEEEEERKARQVEPTETPVLSSKPFSAGPSRERSASTPPRQGQDNNTVNRTPQPTGQQSTNVPPLPQAGVNDISSSEPGPQFVPSPLKGEQSSAGMSANSVNASGAPSSDTLTQVNNNVDPKSVNVTVTVSQQEEAILYPSSTLPQAVLPIVSTPLASKEAEEPVVSPSVSPVRTQRAHSLPNPSQRVNPPPGFYLQDGPRTVPHASGSPITMPSSVSATPTESRPTVGYFEGNPISPQTPPRHHPAVFNAPSGHFVGSPNQMWLQQQHALMMIRHFSPVVRSLVPYPLTPDPQVDANSKKVRGHSDNLPPGLASSPAHGQQSPEHNFETTPKNPPTISRNVMWPVGRTTPSSGERNAQFEGQLPLPHASFSGLPASTSGSPGQLMHHHLTQGGLVGTPRVIMGSPQPLIRGSPQVAVSPHPMAQQLRFPHSPERPPGLGSPPPLMPQTPVQYQQPLPQNLIGAHMTGEQFINLVKVAEEEYKKTENAQMSLEEDKPEELEHLGPKDPKLAETPEEHQLLSKLSQVKSLWEEGASPEMEDAIQITSADSEDATLEQKGALVHPDNKPDDQLPVRREAWVGPDKDSEFKAVCAEEKEDVSGGIQTIVSKSIKGNDGVASIEHQKCDPSFATRSTDVDEKLTGILVGKEEQHESSTTESPAAKTEMPEEPVKQKQPRRGGRARKNKSSKNGNNSASPGEKCPGDFPRKEKQKNYSDFEGSGGGIQTSVSKSIKGNDGVASIEHQKCDPSLAARRTDVVDEKLTGMLHGKEEQRESSTTESTAAKTGMPEEPVKQKQTRRGEQASKNKSSKNGSNSERPEEKSPSDFPSKEKQKSYSDFDGSKKQSTPGKSEEKTSGESPKKGKDKQLWHRNSYDDLKSPRGESAPRKLGKTPPKKKISQQREHQKGFDDFKGSKYECGPKKPDVKSAGGGPKKGDDPQLRHQENYALKAEALKDSREGKKPRAELQERVKGEPQSAERVTGSKAPSLPKNQGTSPRSNAEDKKNPAGNNQAGGPRSSGNSPGVSNKGSRRRRPHRSSNQRWEPASEGGDSRKVNNSTQEERSPKRN